jgi:ubiquinone/menaquinone biosynthesis C-methylase UbiE
MVTQDLFRTYQNFKDELRSGFLEYTRRAYQVMPITDRPVILDVGCGTGVPTIELARLSNGLIIAIDIDQISLEELKNKVTSCQLSAHIDVVKCSLFDMCFMNESFDIIWAEGSINAIGFERGLSEWRRYLKTNGFLVIHDDLGDLNEKIEQVSASAYKLLDHFVLTQDIWWQNYYRPLEKYINSYYKHQPYDTAIDRIIIQDCHFISEFQQNPDRFQSVYLILRRL